MQRGSTVSHDFHSQQSLRAHMYVYLCVYTHTHNFLMKRVLIISFFLNQAL
jgi:hypothetical protein